MCIDGWVEIIEDEMRWWDFWNVLCLYIYIFFWLVLLLGIVLVLLNEMEIDDSDLVIVYVWFCLVEIVISYVE